MSIFDDPEFRKRMAAEAARCREAEAELYGSRGLAAAADDPNTRLGAAIAEGEEVLARQREAFDRATYYDCGDAEELTHKTVEEAIEYEVEQCATKDCDMAALIRERCPLTVDAFKRNEVSGAWVKHTAERVAEDIGEQFDLTYASAADEPKATIDTPAIIAACEAAVWAVANASEVYNCREVASRTYSAEEVEAMMREFRPDWFAPPLCGADLSITGQGVPCQKPLGHEGAHESPSGEGP